MTGLISTASKLCRADNAKSNCNNCSFTKSLYIILTRHKVSPGVAVDSLRDVLGLARDVRFDLHLLGADGVRIAEAVLVLVVVADLVDGLTRKVRYVLFAVGGVGGDFAGYRAVAFLELHLKGDARSAVDLKVLVENVRRNEVARPVGMPDGAVFGSLDSGRFH